MTACLALTTLTHDGVFIGPGKTEAETEAVPKSGSAGAEMSHPPIILARFREWLEGCVERDPI